MADPKGKFDYEQFARYERRKAVEKLTNEVATPPKKKRRSVGIQIDKDGKAKQLRRPPTA